MDSYLSGREQLGNSSKKKNSPDLGPKIMGELIPPPALDSELSEDCGDAGSRIAYVSEEGRVVKIVVTCGCGQVTEIDCKYED